MQIAHKLLAACICALCAVCLTAQPARPDAYLTIQEKCFGCHGPEDMRGELDLTTREAMLAGGESGQPAVVPGDPDASLLMRAITWEDPSLEMPPKENDRLTSEQVEAVRQWILDGAPDRPAPTPVESTSVPQSQAPDGRVRVETSGGQTPEWTARSYDTEKLWAFRPVQRPTLPPASEASNPIDAFIAQRLAEEGLSPAAEAGRTALIRRATYDLIGLPPTPDEIDAFLADKDADAYERLVERLLADPRYGEQWGRRWLDVTRYADTSGFSNDFERPNAWRFRDYVVRSFNEDKPYDRFVVEQIAGDELAPHDPEMRIATGFLRSGPWEQTGMSVAAETRQFFLDDVTNGVGETFLSIPLKCARCHDHKFDPIPTRDYYRVQAAFATTQLAEIDTAHLPAENLAGFEDGKARLERLLAEAQEHRDVINAKEEDAARRWMEERGIEYVPKNERKKLPDDQRPPRLFGLTYEDLGTVKALHKRIQRLRWELDRYRPVAFTVYNGPDVLRNNVAFRVQPPEDLSGEARASHVLVGGSVYAPGEEVSPGVLTALDGVRGAAESAWSTIPDDMGGRRLALANWIANATNPLTTRSIVNRIWQWHFGRGLVASAGNFGVMAEPPTHPELLDWLAVYFVEHGWSFKAMHRAIMTSETYRRSSDGRSAQTDEVDPDNALLSYFSPRRLTAEELRDSMLFASGELNPEMGGLPIYPEINMEVALQPRHIMGSIAPAYQPSRTPEQRNRRTIYAYRQRGMSDPGLEVFNRPSADLSCERREASTVTPQALTLMNSQNSHDRALAMAIRVEEERATEAGRIARTFRRALGRMPTEDELESASLYLAEMTALHVKSAPTKAALPVEIEREMFEEMAGEPFTYIEKLDVYEDYAPDAKPWDVGPETRALSDLCLLLLNANEFIYVY